MSGPNDDNDEDEEIRHKCVDCGTLSPSTETSYTLISSRHGWRLTRGVDDLGQGIMQWHCPKCWAKHRGSSAPR